LLLLTKSEIRQKNGEINLLELNLAKSQVEQIKIQYLELISALETLILKFNYLLNSTRSLEPEIINYKISQYLNIDTTKQIKNLLIEKSYHQKIVAQKKLSLEKNKLLPDLFASYNNISITGTGADNIYYSQNNRFQSVQFGMAVPLFPIGQRAVINAAKTRLNYINNNYTSVQKTFAFNYQIAVKKYEQLKESVELMEQTTLKNSYSTLKIANEKFSLGEINYLEWVILIQNSLENQNLYLEKVNQLNKSIIEFNALNNFK
jgi:cobalt-zinc-cadmium resistance protein CzcA